MPAKADYVNRVNNNLRTLSTAKVDVNATDIGRAAQTIDPNQPPDTPVTIYSTVESGPTTANLPSTAIVGQEIKDMTSVYAKIFARVRLITFQLQGNVSPAGAKYVKYARVTAAVADPTYTGPGSGDPTFSQLDPGQPISLTNYDGIISSLQTTLNTHFEKQAHLIRYCHSSCHSNCHSSRGRR